MSLGWDSDEWKIQGMHWADYLVFALFLALYLGIGIFYGVAGTKTKSTDDFLVGGRDMSILPVALSILSAFLSAILILGTPAEVYTQGMMYWIYIIGMSGAVLLACLLFVPMLYPLRLTSSYEYLEKRFGSRSAKLTGTVILIAMQLLYMGVVLYSPATAIETATGMPEWSTILIGGIVAIIYTSLGGIKASVWTSVFQSAVMAAGVLAVIIKGSIEVGGFDKVWRINEEGGRMEFWSFDPNPIARHTFWTLTVGGTIGWLATYGANQASVQRYSSVPTLNAARITVLLNIPGLIFFVTLCCFAGMVLYAYYEVRGCDPLRSGRVSNSNQILPLFVMQELDIPTIPGIFMACLFSGSLSSMSSSLSSCSAVTWEDMLKWKLENVLSERQKYLLNQVLVLIYGAAGVGMAFMAANLGGTVLQMSLSFTGAAGGPMLGLFLLGGFFPWANWIGAVTGGVLGLAFPLWISSGAYALELENTDLNTSTDGCPRNITTWPKNVTGGIPIDEVSGLNRLYLVSYLWYPAIGAATVVVVGMIVSLVTGPTKLSDVEAKYLMPIFDRLFCCLPAKVRKVLRCGKDMPSPDEILEEETARQLAEREEKRKALFGDKELETTDIGVDNYAMSKSDLAEGYKDQNGYKKGDQHGYKHAMDDPQGHNSNSISDPQTYRQDDPVSIPPPDYPGYPDLTIEFSTEF